MRKMLRMVCPTGDVLESVENPKCHEWRDRGALTFSVEWGKGATMKRKKSTPAIDDPMEVSVAVLVERDGDGFHAYVPALKGLHVDGMTEREAVQRAKEAIDVYLESLSTHGEQLTEGPGLVIHKTRSKTLNVTTRWPSTKLSGANSKIPQPAL